MLRAAKANVGTTRLSRIIAWQAACRVCYASRIAAVISSIICLIVVSSQRRACGTGKTTTWRDDAIRARASKG